MSGVAALHSPEILPIAPVLPQLRAALAQHHAVLTAPTGSGKSTQVPLALLDADWLHGRSILMLEPRRPAARMIAARMAALLGEPIGGRVGHQVRFERRIGPRTRIEVLTEGILTRRIQSDPELAGCGLLIFDEFHERSLNADLGLALALDAAALRPDLRILVMSATLDTAAVSALLGDAPFIRGEGRSHPVAIRHAEPAPPDPIDAMPQAIRTMLDESAGDILVFLPGVAEINRVAAQLEGRAKLRVLPLHGSLPLAEQDQALRPGADDRRRVILATDIAETSLTIEGIATVIDSGLARKPRFEPARGLTRLVTVPIAQDSAEQRTGRAGRLGPGSCLRLWTREQHRSRPARRTAEIRDADLASLALELALWGVSDPEDLAWLDPPPRAAWGQALALLSALGAIDEAGRITAAGRRMVALPLHPRLAHLLTAAAPGDRPTAADLAALLSERDPALRQAGLPNSADLGERLAALADYRAKGQVPGFDRRRLAAIQRSSAQLRRLASRIGADAPAAANGAGAGSTAGGLLALAYPDRIGQARQGGGGAGRYRLADGSGAVLPADDPLAVHDYLVIADLTAAAADHRIRAAVPIDRGELMRVLADRITSRETLDWDDAREAVIARREVRLGALALEATPVPVAGDAAATEMLFAAVARDPTGALNWTDAARQLQARAALARRLGPDAGWPDLSDDWLSAHIREWLGPWLAGKSRLADARALDLASVLRQLLIDTLGWDAAQRLDALAPVTLTTPAGSRRRIDYASGDTPVLAVPLQEMFGQRQTPAIFNGRVPLLLHLLSPAGRPLQITRDLEGFWRSAYADVRREMRGRYPKHHWPEDPLQSQPIKGGLKRHGAKDH